MPLDMIVFPTNNPFAPTYYALPDGSSLIVRPITFFDIFLVREFERGLSDQTVRDRYDFPKKLAARVNGKRVFNLCAVDHRQVIVFIATKLLGKILGVVEMYRDPATPTRAEMAFLVSDDARRKGIGTLLTRATLIAAKTKGIEHACAETAPGNSSMIQSFLAWGFTVQREDGQVRATLNLTN